ncbi:SDR family oxidoreductase [Sphingomonas sp. YL-JM2C]
MRLSGRIAIVTGGSSGIGRATACLLAAEGARVVVTGRHPARCAETVEAIRAAGGEAEAVPCELTDADAAAGLVDRTVAMFGPPDILVANAGIYEAVAFADMTVAQFERMLDVHVIALFACCKAVLPHMAAAKFGRIIVVSSVSGVQGDPHLVHYSASKAAQIGFARALAREVVTQGITINIVAPGLTDTPMTQAVDILPQYVPPIGRMGSVDDQAAAILYFATDEAGFVTGQLLSPNGGVHM